MWMYRCSCLGISHISTVLYKGIFIHESNYTSQLCLLWANGINHFQDAGPCSHDMNTDWLHLCLPYAHAECHCDQQFYECLIMGSTISRMFSDTFTFGYTSFSGGGRGGGATCACAHAHTLRDKQISNITQWKSINIFLLAVPPLRKHLCYFKIAVCTLPLQNWNMKCMQLYSQCESQFYENTSH